MFPLWFLLEHYAKLQQCSVDHRQEKGIITISENFCVARYCHHGEISGTTLAGLKLERWILSINQTFRPQSGVFVRWRPLDWGRNIWLIDKIHLSNFSPASVRTRDFAMTLLHCMYTQWSLVVHNIALSYQMTRGCAWSCKGAILLQCAV